MTSTSNPRLLLATTNSGKLEELHALLHGASFSILSPADLGLELEVAEAGADYAANARAKAVAFAQATGLWALADDTGLEVDALGGAPGLFSRRLAGSDLERRQRLLHMLASFRRPWTATFRSAVALAGPTGALLTADGACLGEILPAPRGQGGFGYDPLFLVAGTNRTIAELSLEEKNRLSHRGRAVRALLPELQARLVNSS
jgi:XTP/dITP diphosphohydrolase